MRLSIPFAALAVSLAALLLDDKPTPAPRAVPNPLPPLSAGAKAVAVAKAAEPKPAAPVPQRVAVPIEVAQTGPVIESEPEFKSEVLSPIYLENEIRAIAREEALKVCKAECPSFTGTEPGSVLVFKSPGCGPCGQLERESLANFAFAGRHLHRVDAADPANAACLRYYGVDAFPTVVVIDAPGRYRKHVGYLNPGQFAAFVGGGR